MKLSNIIKKPIVTEKSFALAKENKYIFETSVKASKGSIKNEIHRLFDVDVINVQTAVMPGKKKRIFRTRRFTKTPRWKKAIVQLKKGQSIDLIEREEAND